ncbi:hypothetical protein [Bradyrhizobium sp. STM 3562]|uniref:hypothetical protein n=1 Tax=Bradyrhizobium sp. STM 3562 TaxID=578924 RepID=UPI00388D2A4A
MVFDAAPSAVRNMRVSIRREVKTAIAFSLIFAVAAFGATVAIVKLIAHYAVGWL